MDPQRFKDAYQRLDLLDERLRHKIRPQSSMRGTNLDQVDGKVKDLANYTLELKGIVEELFLAIAGKPPSKSP